MRHFTVITNNIITYSISDWTSRLKLIYNRLQNRQLYRRVD